MRISAQARRGRSSFRPAVIGIGALLLIVVTAVVTVRVMNALNNASVGVSIEADGVQSNPGVIDPGEVGASAEIFLLEQLAVVSGESRLPYDRGEFGQRWADVDRNGCDTRNDILRRDLEAVEIKSDTNGCKVLAGTLIDPYADEEVHFLAGDDTSRLVQIDHVVPLAWAWRHGADAWSSEERTAFANDPLNLQATTERMNSSKGDSGPSRWLPPGEDAFCGYAERFVGVLVEWDLGISIRDRAVLRGVLIECARG